MGNGSISGNGISSLLSENMLIGATKTDQMRLLHCERLTALFYLDALLREGLMVSRKKGVDGY